MAHGAQKRRPERDGSAGNVPLDDDAVARIIERNGQELLRVARANSANAADADDAYQNALEALLTKSPTGDEQQLVPWLVVVTRNAARMIRRRNKHFAPESFDSVARAWEADESSPDEQILERESLDKRAEALAHLRPDQVRCLMLKAEGFNYREISRITGLTYASVNRYLTDGRRAFRAALGSIARGDQCELMQPVLSAIADGECDESTREEAQRHLKHCASCRAALVEYRSIPRLVATLLPVAEASSSPATEFWRQLSDGVQGAFSALQERSAGIATKLQFGPEAPLWKKSATVAAVGTALAAGSFGAGQMAANDRDRQSIAGEARAAAVNTLPTGPTGEPPSDRGQEQPAETKPNQPSPDEIRSARNGQGDEPAPAAPSGDEDPFVDQRQFEPPVTEPEPIAEPEPEIVSDDVQP